MLNSKFKAHFSRSSALALLITISLSCFTSHSLAEAADTNDSKQIKVQLYTDDKALDFSLDKVNYLNFTASIGLVSPDSRFTDEANFQVPKEDLVQLTLPESAATQAFSTSNELKSNEFAFQAKRKTAWLLNLQLKGYELVKTTFNREDSILRLDYRPRAKELDYQANYFTGKLNSFHAKSCSDLKAERKNLLAVLRQANVKADKTASIYNVITGEIVSENKLTEKSYLFALADTKSDLAPALQTLSYTLISNGKAQANELYNLPLVQAAPANVYTGKNEARKDSDRAENAKINKAENAKADNSDNKLDTASLKKDTNTDSKLLEQAELKVKDDNKSASLVKDDKEKVKRVSKYTTKVISPNNTSIVPSTGESAASVGLSLLCFITATAVYAIKRHFN